ncbi:hypothetical protein IJI70_02915 [Candidatus Saccharibacteria bacterium]|nr:hypothetical protein [Candidatus Saccharibacteria bacterium]
MDRISFVNRTYFGDLKSTEFDKSTVNFLPDDFKEVLKILLQREILIYLIKGSGEKYTSSRRDSNGAIVYGDFDPLGCLEFQELYKSTNIRLVTSVRQLIKPERKRKDSFFTGKIGGCTGGDFIKDLLHLQRKDFEDYIKKRPSFLSSADDGDRILFKALSEKVTRFNSKNYSNLILSDLESITLHKDKEPAKRKLLHRKLVEYSPDFKMNYKTYRDKLEIPVKSLSSCLNEFGEIIDGYNTIFRPRCLLLPKKLELPVKPYMENFSKIFRIQLTLEDKNRLLESLKNNLGNSFNVICWKFL